MILDFEPGDRVVNPLKKDWGIGQVQSIVKEKVTVNFENKGKIVINAKNINLESSFNKKIQINTSKLSDGLYFIFFNTFEDS